MKLFKMSTILATMEIQIKKNGHFTPVRMTNITKIMVIMLQRMWGRRDTYQLGRIENWSSHSEIQCGQSLAI